MTVLHLIIFDTQLATEDDVTKMVSVNTVTKIRKSTATINLMHRTYYTTPLIYPP